MLITKDEIKNFLPHREPFLFVDSVESITLPAGADEKLMKTSKDLVGAQVVAHFEVKKDLEILRGHFPGNPILPGVVQVEMMAQSAAFVALPLIKNFSSEKDVETLLLSVEGAKFRKPIVPGDHLIIHSKMIKSRGQVASYESYIELNGEKVSEAIVLARLVFNDKE